MINLQIFAVGTVKDAWLREGCGEYLKRMRPWGKCGVTEIGESRLPARPSPAQIQSGILQEGVWILEKLPKNSRVVALCVEGRPYTSEDLARYLEKSALEGMGTVSFVIGGSYGLSEKVKQQADLCLSMSSMTFPHQLARLMLCEQLYRALSILGGTAYHK